MFYSKHATPNKSSTCSQYLFRAYRGGVTGSAFLFHLIIRIARRGRQRCPIFQTGQLRLGRGHAAGKPEPEAPPPAHPPVPVLPTRSQQPLLLDLLEIGTERSALLSFPPVTSPSSTLPRSLGSPPPPPTPPPPRNFQHLLLKTLLASLCTISGQLSWDIPISCLLWDLPPLSLLAQVRGLPEQYTHFL